MKNQTKFLFLLTLMFAFTCAAPAQQRNGDERVSREQLAEKQARHIAEQLALSQADSERFIATYVECQKEIWALGPKNHKTRKGTMSEDQTDSLLLGRFDHSQKILDVRKKYYAEYRKFLTAKQVERVYELERQMMKRLKDRRNSRRR